MANNRLWLVHRPTGRAVKLGKRMAWGWYDPPSQARLQAFFDAIPYNQDDFFLAIEDNSGAPLLRVRWKDRGAEDGFRIITPIEGT